MNYVDVPFTNGEFSSSVFSHLDTKVIECDESILVFSITKEVDSINFKNAIIQSILPFELPDFEKDIEEMIIEEDYGNDYYGNLIIENYPNLQSIVVKKNSLQNLNSLKICNCDKLKMIETEDGDGWHNTSFLNLKEVALMSSSYWFTLWLLLDLPSLLSLQAGKFSFIHVSSLFLSSIFHTLLIKQSDLPKLEYIRLGDVSCRDVSTLSLSSIIISD